MSRRKKLEFYHPLKVIRDHGNPTQISIAEKLGCSNINVQSMIHNSPSLTTVKRLADVLDAEVVEFFTPLPLQDLIERGVVAPKSGKPE